MGDQEQESDDSMPWEKTSEAELKQQEMTVVSCHNCDHVWPPQVERPKYCTKCNHKLNYVDETAELREGESDDDEAGDEGDDLESWLEGDDE